MIKSNNKNYKNFTSICWSAFPFSVVLGGIDGVFEFEFEFELR